MVLSLAWQYLIISLQGYKPILLECLHVQEIKNIKFNIMYLCIHCFVRNVDQKVQLEHLVQHQIKVNLVGVHKTSHNCIHFLSGIHLVMLDIV